MKNKLLLIIFTTTISCISIAQEKSELKLVRVESNGVQVYEASGNETFVSNENEQISPTRTLNDWDVEECENALYYIGLKIEKMKENEGNEHLILEYEAQIVLINERLNSLNSKK